MLRTFEGFTKGINLGGWLSQNHLTPEHLAHFITEPDIEKISSLGVDHVRLPIDYNLVEDEEGNTIESGYLYIDNCIQWCTSRNLNVVLDLHKTAGYVFDDSEYSASFFHNAKLQERFMKLWDKLSARYGQYSDHVAFELLNEVVDPDVADIWNSMIEEVIQRIRKNAPDTWILVGGTRSNSIITLKDLKAPYDDKIAFNFHCYEPLIVTHQAAYWVDGMPKNYTLDYPISIQKCIDETERLIDPNYAFPIKPYADLMCGKDFFRLFFNEAILIAEQYNVPLYCGEYGVINMATPEIALRWYQDIHAVFEEYGIARAAWTYKEMDFGITDEHYSPIFEELLKNL